MAWRVVDAVVVAGIAVAGLALARGAVSATALNGGTDPLLASLPIIAVVCGGLLVGRAWPALAVIGTRILPRSFLAGRIGVGGAVRRPLRPVATAAFLAAATGCVVFAAAYQATLHQGAADQAAFTVPLDATVTVGTTLVNPLSVGTTADFARTRARHDGPPGVAREFVGAAQRGRVERGAGVRRRSGRADVHPVVE